jgi:hypothetical protein
MPKHLSNIDFNNQARATNMLDAVDPQDAVTKAQLDSAVEGLNWKASVRVSTVSNINLSASGSTIDGISMVANDRVLVMAQTNAADNGIYIWNGAAVVMTRSLDASTAKELEQATVTVEEGTNAGSTFRQTLVNFTLGSGLVAFSAFGNAAPSASEVVAGIAEVATQAETDAGMDDLRIVTPAKLKAWSGKSLKYNTTIGDSSATQFTVTHNLGTRNLGVTLSRAASPYDIVIADVEMTTINSVTIRFAAAPTANQFNVFIDG